MSDTIRISGLPEDYDEEDVYALCSEHGEVLDIVLVSDDYFADAWVTFQDEWEAELAANLLDGMVGDGFSIQVFLSDQLATA